MQPLAAWKAGAAAVKITPDEPVWQGGYASREHASTGVLDDIFVKAVVLEDDTGARSVLVAADLVGFTAKISAEIARKVEDAHGVPRDRIVFNASHTHSAPTIDNLLTLIYPMQAKDFEPVDRYTRKFVGWALEAVEQAMGRLERAELSFEQGFAGFAVNRRRVRNRELPGPVDHDVPVMAIRGPDGLRAVVFGYACHATVLNGYEISGDWPGYAQSALERQHPGVVALFMNGCGADQNPLPRRSVALAKRYGETLADAVSQVLDAGMHTLRGPLVTAYEDLEAPLQTPPSRAELERRIATESDRGLIHANEMLRRLDRDGGLPSSLPMPIQVWRFHDDLTWIFLGGEVVVDYSLRFKQTYGWDTTWVSGYSNDVFTYIPSLRVLREGDYEGGGAMLGYGHPRPFTAEIEELIADKVDELVQRTTPAIP